MKYIGVARRKITRLIAERECLGIIDSDDEKVTIRFSSNSCTVDKWGRVEWLDTEEEIPQFKHLNP
jgi:hypothetical protein